MFAKADFSGCANHGQRQIVRVSPNLTVRASAFGRALTDRKLADRTDRDLLGGDHL